jgi:hypothetical protein
MTTLNLPKSAVIGTQISWVTLVDGFSSATHDLTWSFGFQSSFPETIIGTAQTPPQAGWISTSDFAEQILGFCPWSLTVLNRSTLALTEVATGTLFLETPEYNTQRLTAEAAEAAILKIMQNGGNQSISIKGRSSSKYGLADLQNQASRARSQMNRLLNGSAGSQVLVRFDR